MSSALPQQRIAEQAVTGLRERMPRADDARVMRFGWSAGLDLDLSDRTGSRFVGNYTTPDGREAIGRRTLVAFTPAVTLAMWEVAAVVGGSIEAIDAADPLGQYEMNCLAAENEGYSHQSSRVLTRPSRTVAYDLMREYEGRGMCLFEHMKGEENWPLLQSLYDVVWPEDAIKPVTRRRVDEAEVFGVFLDQVRAYLRDHGLNNLNRAGLSRESEGGGPSEYEMGEGVLRELRAACDRAWTHMTKTVADSNQEIRQRMAGSNKGKVWYDGRDADFLVETNVTPMNRKEAEAEGAQARAQQPQQPPVNVGEIVGEAVREVVRELLPVREAQALEPQISPAVARLAAENDELRERLARLEGLMTQGGAQPASQPPAPPAEAPEPEQQPAAAAEAETPAPAAETKQPTTGAKGRPAPKFVRTDQPEKKDGAES